MKTKQVLRILALAGLLLTLLLGTASVYAQDGAAETITFGEGETTATVDADLADAAEVDLYEVEVTAGQTLQVEVPEGFKISVIDIGGDEVLVDLPANARTFSETVATTGTYEIAVASNTETGDYTLTVTLPAAENDAAGETGGQETADDTGAAEETGESAATVAVTTAASDSTETVDGYYTVAAGDTLYSIALKFETTVAALQSANELGASTIIYTGQKLYIPGTDAPPGVRVYTVQAGDTLYSIATRFGMTVAALQSANGLTGTQIYVGQQLTVFIEGGTGGPGVRIYTVLAGDTLYSISRKFGVSVQDLEAINDIAASGYIYPGQVLDIPVAQTYTVQRGDYLNGIAARFGTTAQAIAALNGITNANLIYPGQVLQIP